MMQSSSLNKIQQSLRDELDKAKSDIVQANYDKLQLTRDNKKHLDKITELTVQIADLTS